MYGKVGDMISKGLSRGYQFLTGINPNALKENSDDTLGAILAMSGLAHSPAIETWQQFTETKDSFALAELFTTYGSDKATRHNYYLAYSALLDRTKDLKILEIGLGTNDTSFKSNMGVNGKPGASLRAFRDWAPTSQVYGADIDKGCLFTEDRISTFYVDQTKPETFKELQGLGTFDIIIDDGLHTPWANFNTICFGLPLLNQGGVMVVEDILERYLPLWYALIGILTPNYDCKLVKMKTEIICIITTRQKV